MEFFTSTQDIEMKDQDGNVLIKAPLLDLSFFIGTQTRRVREAQPDIDLLDLAKLVVPQINTEFNCELSYGQFMQLSAKVNQEMNELKKKNCSTLPELHQSTT